MHDALLTPEVWHLLCHSIARVNNSILLLQTGSTKNTSRATPLEFPLDLEAMRKSFESHGIHRSRLLFVDRASQFEPAGLVMAVSAAAAADVVVDFSASSAYALAAAAPVSHGASSQVKHFDVGAGSDRTARLAVPSCRRWALRSVVSVIFTCWNAYFFSY
jgi:hypothetical protein